MNMSIEKKLDRIQRSIDALESGRYTEFSASYCADYLSWCYRFRRDYRQRVLKMVNQLTEVFEYGIKN